MTHHVNQQMNHHTPLLCSKEDDEEVMWVRDVRSKISAPTWKKALHYRWLFENLCFVYQIQLR